MILYICEKLYCSFLYLLFYFQVLIFFYNFVSDLRPIYLPTLQAFVAYLALLLIMIRKSESSLSRSGSHLKLKSKNILSQAIKLIS